jgi:hypothetical protein
MSATASASSTVRPSKVEKRFARLDTGIHTVALGNMTSFQVMVVHRDEDIGIGIVGVGCHTFSNFVSKGYVMEKLKLGDGDAGNVADFINDQLYVQLMDRQGRYDYPDLLAK